MKYLVEPADIRIGGKSDVLITNNLGSCLGLIAYEPEMKIGGLLRAVLPSSKINPEKAIANPCMFVDTGVPLLFEKIRGAGNKNNSIMVKAVGCSNPLGNSGMFRIGQKNYSILEKLLMECDISLTSSIVGGTFCKAVQFYISTGRTVVLENGKEREL